MQATVAHSLAPRSCDARSSERACFSGRVAPVWQRARRNRQFAASRHVNHDRILDITRVRAETRMQDQAHVDGMLRSAAHMFDVGLQEPAADHGPAILVVVFHYKSCGSCISLCRRRGLQGHVWR